MNEREKEEWYDVGLENFVLDFARNEDERQLCKYGHQSHPPALWMLYLTEEAGELSEAISTYLYGRCADPLTALDHIRREAIQVATLALKMAQMAHREGVRRTP